MYYYSEVTCTRDNRSSHPRVIMPDQEAPPKNASQKQMTKAERRELQERQRAAKLVQKQQKQQGPPGGQGESAAPSSAKPNKVASAGHKRAASGYDAGTTGKQSAHQAEDTASAKSRALRIFSHFGLGLPKTLGQGVKGDVHPAVVRLALLFSEFQICGANARCIATLTAFKTVCALFLCP